MRATIPSNSVSAASKLVGAVTAEAGDGEEVSLGAEGGDCRGMNVAALPRPSREAVDGGKLAKYRNINILVNNR